jgi:hypothetical protein
MHFNSIIAALVSVTLVYTVPTGAAESARAFPPSPALRASGPILRAGAGAGSLR